MINTPKHNTKSSSSKLLLNLITIHDLIFCLIEVISLIIVETVVENTIIIILLWVFILTCELTFDVLTDSFVFWVETTVIDHIKVCCFLFFIRWELVSVILDKFFWWHWKWSTISFRLSDKLFLNGNLTSRYNWHTLFWWCWISILNSCFSFLHINSLNSWWIFR